MKRFISIVLLLIPISGYATTPKIIPSKDMTYLGAFKLPPPPSGYGYPGGDGGADGLKGLEYYPHVVPSDPPDGTLIVLLVKKGAYWNKFPAKYSIVTPVKSKVLANLNTASLIHPPADIAGTAQHFPGYTQVGDIHYLPAKGSQSTGKLYWSVYSSYSCDMYQFCNGQFGWAETNFDSFNSQGMWRFRSTAAGSNAICPFVGKYLFHAPQAWADLYTGGKSLLAGYTRSGGSRTMGPPVFAFAPWLSCGGTPINCDTNPPPDARNNATLLGHEDPSPAHVLDQIYIMGYGGMPTSGAPPVHALKTNGIDDWGIDDFYTSARWITLGSKQAVIFAGVKMLRYLKDYNWTYASLWYPWANMAGYGEGGYKDIPSIPALWFFDVDDITAATCTAQTSRPSACSGIPAKQRYDVQAYRRVDLNPFLFNYGTLHGLMGMAYDETNKKMYLEELIDSNTEVIHVFRLGDSGITTLDTIPPTSPTVTLSSVSKSSVTFTWNAVTDPGNTDKPVNYRIYRNGQALWVQSDTTSYTDNYLSYYTAPVDYRVDAVDFEGNVASSTLSIDNTTCVSGSCGNAPMSIFIPTLSYWNIHETSELNLRINVANSFPIRVRGGTPPYTWSEEGTALPPGITIVPDANDSSIAYVSGTPTARYSEAKCNITVHDSSSPASYARRKTHIRVVSSGGHYTDRDMDGIADINVGGTDTDDTDCESTPGMTYVQPPIPTNSLFVSTYSPSSVTLSWSAAPKRTDKTWWQDHGGATTCGRANYNGLDMYYQVYHGTSTGVYYESRFVGRNTTYTWTGLQGGTHFFAVRAVEFRNRESVYSNEVSQSL